MPYTSAVAILAAPGRPKGRILIVTRGHHLQPDGHWSLGLPGGHREPGEQAAETMLRELREETGLMADSYQPLGLVTDPKGKEVAIYAVDTWTGRPRSSSEGRVMWLPWERLMAPSQGRYADFHREIFYRYLRRELIL
jgi:8-oxo-dGTP pyrophosphatase MutT (NUDIX family)